MNEAGLAPVTEPAGDRFCRKARRWARVALVALLITLPCVIFMKTLWNSLITLGPTSFWLAASVWGLVLAAGPVLFVVGVLTALFLRMEAVVSPRTLRHPIRDVLVTATALIVSLVPSVAALYPPVKALLTGTIGFRGLGQQYPLASDPYGFWQAVAFWFMGAFTLAFLAFVYWRGKCRQHASHKIDA